MTESRRDLRATKKRGRQKLRFTTVLGELLIVAGIGVFGYIVWQPWHTGVTVQNAQQGLAKDLSSTWGDVDKSSDDRPVFDGEVPVTPEQVADDAFAVLHVPAFGRSYANVIAEGVSDWGVLNPSDKGIGRYPDTQQFGELGNVAMAAHRSGAFITPFRDITNLRVGDPLFIETAEGWYVYRYRSTEYVWPEETDVLNTFPRLEVDFTEDRILTLTSCHPKEWSTAERVISYSVFEDFVPIEDGPPQELLDSKPHLAQNDLAQSDLGPSDLAPSEGAA